MKRFLLLSACALGVMAMSADEVDITPKNYKFYETKATTFDELGINDGYSHGKWNLDTWFWESHVAEVYNEGYLTWGCNPAPDVEKTKSQIGIVDFGGEIGKVLSISTMGSDINAAMKEHFGEGAPEVVVPAENSGQKEWFWYFNGAPEKYPYLGEGKYMRIRLQVNVFCNEPATGKTIGGNMYINTNANNVAPQGDENSVGNALSTVETVSETEGEDEFGDIVVVQAWDPTKWSTIEWYFACIAPDESGNTHGPKLKMNLQDNYSYTLFIRQIELTAIDGECPAMAPHQRTVETFNVEPVAGIASASFDANAPKEYYNLQGVRVANPENGLYIVKQGNTAKKVLVK